MGKLANHHLHQAQKFGSTAEAVYSDEELGEDSVLLESPLDKIDPYATFKNSLMSKLQAFATELWPVCVLVLANWMKECNKSNRSSTPH